MKIFSPLFFSILLLQTPLAFAAEWQSVTQNSVGDRFFVDKSSVQRKDATVAYWEYREFPQANNAFLAETVDKPVHGAVLSWSANCANKTQQLRQITAYDKDRQVIRRFVYGEAGASIQSRPGSSTHAVLEFVCNEKLEAEAR